MTTLAIITGSSRGFGEALAIELILQLETNVEMVKKRCYALENDVLHKKRMIVIFIKLHFIVFMCSFPFVIRMR